jgi:hypothetical protein
VGTAVLLVVSAIAGRAAIPIKPAASKALTSGALLLSGNRLPALFPRHIVKTPE